MNKIAHVSRLPLILIVCVLTGLSSQAQPGTSKEKTAKWFDSKVWLGGLQLKPSVSIDEAAFTKQYQLTKGWWDKAFAFMKEKDLATLKPGKYPIDGENVFATVTEAPSKAFDKTQWESHRNYSDIQYIIKGKEKIGAAPVSAITIRDQYDPKRDVVFYNGEGKYYEAGPDTFFIFTPADAHRPSVIVEGYDVVKKLVIKVSTNKADYHGN